VIVATATILVTAWRVLRDPVSPTFDDAWYIETGLRLFAAMREGPSAFFVAWSESLRMKAPLVCLLPAPLYALLGPSESLAPLSNLPLLALAWIGTARIGTRLFGRDAGDASAIALALMPLGYGLSRFHLVEPLLTAIVVWTVALTLESEPERGRGTALGALIGLGLLAKVSFPIFVAGPLWLKRRELRPHATRITAVAAAIAATWYASNLVFVVGFAWQASFGSLAGDYGATGLVALAAWAWRLLDHGTGAAQGAIMIATLAAAGRRLGAAGMFCAAWISPLALFALSANKEIRLSAPLLPALAVAGAGAWATLSPRWRAASGAAYGLSGLALLSGLAFGVPGVEARAFNGEGEEAGWDRAALVRAIDTTAKDSSMIAVAIEHPRLNANNLASAAAAAGRPWRTTSLGYAQTGVEGALIRLKDKGADHLVLVAGVPSAQLPAFLNRANAGVEAAVATGRLKARETTRVMIAPGVEARILVLIR
jgi:4-amino-4-deoxy-L-arabinose transferase-like glycosyltransferase